MATNTDNYKNIDYDDFTIDDIDVDSGKPILVGYKYSIKNVFDGLNKIIKAIISKFKSIDSAMSNRANEVDNRFLGKYGTLTVVASGQSLPYGTDSGEKTVSLGKTYTHGYVGGNGTGLLTLCQLTPSVYVGDIFGESVNGHNGRGTLFITLDNESDSNQTILKASFSSNGNYDYVPPNGGFIIQYELY